MILHESDLEHRVIRKDKSGAKWEYSDKDGRPSGEGWTRVDQRKHPRATKYLWVRSYSYVANEMRRTERQPLIKKPTDLVSIDPRLVPTLDVEVGNLINEFRNNLRKQFEYEKNPFLAGDRIRIANKEGVFYVKGVNPVTKRLVAVSATNPDKVESITHEDAKIDNERGTMPWYFGDTVKVAAGVIDKNETSGEVVGYDNHTNKVRIQIGTSSFEVYPEAIIGIRGKNADVLKDTKRHLEENPNSFASPEAKQVMESLLRASLEGRRQVGVQEVVEDVEATTGTKLTMGSVRGTFQALSTLLQRGSKHSVYYNPTIDSMDIEYGNLPIRMICNLREIKNTHKSFGWKNIRASNPYETYAHIGQKVKLPPNTKDSEGKTITEGRVRRVDGNKIEVAVGNTTKMLHMGEVQDAAGRAILPDPTDPAAFGSINKSAFWLLRDREWVRDYKPGDIVSIAQTLEDAAGEKTDIGEFGKVIDTTSNGTLIVKTNKGKKVTVSPRQVRQNRKVENVQQLFDKARHDPHGLYGTSTVIGTSPDALARVGVGSDHKHKFLQVNFESGDAYRKMEEELFASIIDHRATLNGTRVISPLSVGDENREGKTLVPNHTMMEVIRRLYPTAKTFMVTREMKRFPGAKLNIKGAPKPPGDTDLDKAIRDTPTMQPSRPGMTTTYKDYYEPDDLGTGYRFDDKKGEFFPEEDADRVGVSKWDFINPWGDKPPYATKSYSPTELDAMSRHTPVSIRILIDPSEKDVAGRVGTVHQIPTVLRELNPSKAITREKGKYNIEDLDWSKRIKISTDGTNVYVDLGSELVKMTSDKFVAPNGQPLTLHQLTKMPISHKYTAWQERYDEKVFASMLLQSSLLSYDKRTKRFQTRLEHYSEVHDFLKNFFGASYEHLAFEDVDGAHAFSATERKLAKEAISLLATRVDQRYKVVDDTPKQVTSGFAYKLMGYNGEDATPEDEAAWAERDYQRETLSFLLNNPKTLLANDQGTGKTGCMLGAIMGRINQQQAKKVLVVAPANLVQTSWPEEIEFWCRDQDVLDKIKKDKSLSPEAREVALRAVEPSVNYTLLTSRNKDKFFSEVYQSDEPLIAVASYDMMSLHAKELQRAGFDMVVLDEAQNIKTGTTDKRKGALRTRILKDMFIDTPYKIAATGTPVENSAEDLHSIVEWLDPNILGPADQFMQDFVETDFVQTPDGLKPVNVAIKNPWDLHARMNGIFKRYSKDYLREREQKKIKEKLGDDFSPALHYGSIAPRLVYPPVTLDIDGSLKYPKMQRPSEFALDPNLAQPIDLSNTRDLEIVHGVPPGTYDRYRRAVSEVNRYYASQFKGMSNMRTKYGGTVNRKASMMTTRMQQVLNDPSILASKDPHFANNPLFTDPLMPNPKFDRLKKILEEHDRKPLNVNYTDLEYTPLDKDGKKKNRERALRTRGKTIIFCQSVEAMKSLQDRLEADPKYRGRVAFYAGTGSIGELSGRSGGGKKLQREALHRIKHDDNVDILIANDAAQTGLSIPQADLVVNYEMNWNPQAMNQRIDRAHRMGRGASNQHRPVTAINLITARSVEEKKVRAHAFRNQLFDVLVNTEEKTQLSKKDRERRMLLDMEKVGKGLAPALHGENHTAIMNELINENEDLANITAMSEKNIRRSLAIRKTRQKQREFSNSEKRGIIASLFKW